MNDSSVTGRENENVTCTDCVPAPRAAFIPMVKMPVTPLKVLDGALVVTGTKFRDDAVPVQDVDVVPVIPPTVAVTGLAVVVMPAGCALVQRFHCIRTSCRQQTDQRPEPSRQSRKFILFSMFSSDLE